MRKGTKITLIVLSVFLALGIAVFVAADLFLSSILTKQVNKSLAQLPGCEASVGDIDLRLFSGTADVVYNWNRRVFAGVSAQWATAREGKDFYVAFGNKFDCHVPGWVDLGVTAEFRANNRFSLWAEGRNLLNQTVMRNFMVAEKGPYFTAGICLNF